MVLFMIRAAIRLSSLIYFCSNVRMSSEGLVGLYIYWATSKQCLSISFVRLFFFFFLGFSRI